MSKFTVKRLREFLEKCNPDALVILSSDSEGNSYHPLHNVEEMGYVPLWQEAVYLELTPELIEQGYTEEDVNEAAEPAVVFWPGW